MNKITTEELVLLSGLFLSKRTISGNKRRDGMKRLVDENTLPNNRSASI